MGGCTNSFALASIRQDNLTLPVIINFALIACVAIGMSKKDIVKKILEEPDEGLRVL